ncbi:hypothetical protein C5167_031641 [Papaver somniferum]|uniref:Uncharacterized protein n=1 Tax=Papaver somniferum TaxID=3469 RepID=A0A4Y7K8S5_PAPSO|nr:hypothetical protein C5167_031641 [Papaver somniferum]
MSFCSHPLFSSSQPMNQIEFDESMQMEVHKLTEKLQGIGIASASADGPVVRGHPKMCDLCYLMAAIYKTEGLLTNSGGMVVNDIVGTLALGNFHDKDTLAVLIIGTGTNAWCVERTDAIIKTQGLITNSSYWVLSKPPVQPWNRSPQRLHHQCYNFN